MRHFLLFYDAVDDYVARRAQFRATHLEYAWKSCERGELYLGGALDPPHDQAVFLFKTDDKRVVEDFARNDPYVIQGLVKSWRVREWLTVAGNDAANPVKLPQA